MIQQIQESGGGSLSFDKCIATPDMMPKLGKVRGQMNGRGVCSLGQHTMSRAQAEDLNKRFTGPANNCGF